MCTSVIYWCCTYLCSIFFVISVRVTQSTINIRENLENCDTFGKSYLTFVLSQLWIHSFIHKQTRCTSQMSPFSNYFLHAIKFIQKLISFPMLRLTKLPPPFGGGFTFYYTSHVIKWFIPHVHRARPLNRFENGSNLAENRIEYILLTSWDGNSVFFSANRAWPSLQKLPSNGFTEWNFVRNKEKAYQSRD